MRLRRSEEAVALPILLIEGLARSMDAPSSAGNGVPADLASGGDGDGDDSGGGGGEEEPLALREVGGGEV